MRPGAGHLDMERTAAPAVPLLSLAEAQAHLRVDRTGGDAAETADDGLIAAMVLAATEEIDGIDGWLGRALVTQTWRLRLPCWPSRGGIVLPLPPFQAVTDFRVTTAAGAELVLVEDTDFVAHGREPGWVEPPEGASWPAVAARGLPIAVTWRCGYGDAAADVPAIIRAYVRMRLGQLYEHREAIVVGAAVAELPFVRHMIDGYRVRGALP
jgi:uncharacterized phiE125 gp8 family phage protein